MQSFDIQIQKTKEMVEKRDNNLNTQMKKVFNNITRLDVMQESVDHLMQDMNKGRDLSLYCSKSIPVLINLAVCEALDKVVGADYRQQIIDFEKFKTKEIDNYIQQNTTNNSFKQLHDRLQVLNRFFRKHDMGLLPFSYGMDINLKMNSTQISHVSQSYTDRTNQRIENLQECNREFKDVWD